MIRTHRLAAIAAAATVSACTTGNVAIRPIAAPTLAASTPSERVVEGRAKLALGSVGLALESFRRALREDPSSVDALMGLAACYEQMGRFDLSARQYEAALAIAPANAELLDRLASSRAADGKPQVAQALREEASVRRADTGARVPTAAAIATIVGQDSRLSVPERPVTAVTEKVAVIRPRTPKLVRVSMGEIALVTAPDTLWEKPKGATRVAARPAEIHVLNAARVAKLAARTRDNMSRRGWNNVSVGDAPATRQTSVIRYPAHARTAAHRLAAQYGFEAVADPSVRFITVYLGRDSAPRS